MREVDLATFAARHRDGAVVIDVREPSEYLSGHVPGAELIPMNRLSAHLARLPRNRPVYVICAGGDRSLSVTGHLVRAGIDAWSVAGGTRGWQGVGHPVVNGAHAA